MSFRRRLALFLTLVLVAVQGLTGLYAYLYLRQDLLSRAQDQLSASTSAFTRQLELLSERVADGVEVMSFDYALRAAIAKHDTETQYSAFRNHGRRIGATRMMMVEMDGKITADTARSDAGQRFPYSELLQMAAKTDKGTGLVSNNGFLYWVVAVPVKAPIPIAYIAAFIPVDDALLQKVRSISATREALALTTVAPNGSWNIATQSGDHRLAIRMDGHGPLPGLSRFKGREYLDYSESLPVVTGSAPVTAVLQYSLDDALAAYRGIITPMLAVLLLGLVIMLVGGALIVRGVSRPLETLAGSARRIADGDYTPLPPPTRNDEIGALTQALAVMTARIAEREQKLKNAVAVTEQAKDEAVSANRAKSQFLSNMSHELRTPLNAILGFSEMIGSQVLGPVGVPKYATYASDIHDAGKHLLTQVERMLDLADAEENRFVIARESVCLGQVVRGALADLAPFAEQSQVALSCALPDAWPMTSGDASKLKQAFANILHNAIRFSLAGGSIAVSAAIAREVVTITVCDNGIGMEADVVASVTRPFHRLRSAFDGTHQGAGLGLPFAKIVVDHLGGSLTIDSAPGKGTSVTIALPIAIAHSEAA